MFVTVEVLTRNRDLEKKKSQCTSLDYKTEPRASQVIRAFYELCEAEHCADLKLTHRLCIQLRKMIHRFLDLLECARCHRNL